MENKNSIYDVVIIGSGPAGMAAAIYAHRAKLKTLVLEKDIPGGQIINTYEVDNYPGIPDVSGFELSTRIREHAEKLGVQIQTNEVQNIEIDDSIKKVKTIDGEFQTKTVILATGARWKKLGVEGEEKYTGLGVSYCATCDGAFFNGKDVAVVGGGDVAVEDAIFLSRMCKKVYLLHRRDSLRAVKILQDKLFECKNVEVLWNTEVLEVKGDNFVTGINTLNNKSKDEQELSIDGLFVGIGTDPNSELIRDKVECDGRGYVITAETCETSVEGIFAAGDLRQKSLRQIVTAAADGATAIYASERYILEKF